ncbi:hypothetical protein FisN_5Lu206 [Fistulifera solaris]|uniref:Uncharacterized protein n=1 Tax=Fistulifera solaris TaxID=1519565 RepID=A0A1Z5JIR8_FISSO|nr:hypothetical protein FisN_5Lu206 [Fistulifera solaris]|eukprot:GAX13895.1 hypothetical protein FisN_5Lu206 [Fistulifera solaris]
MLQSPHNRLSLCCLFWLITMGSSSPLRNNLRTRLLNEHGADKCLLDVHVQCTVEGNEQLPMNCDDFVPAPLLLAQCTETPFSVTMLLRGDRCQPSNLGVDCQDHFPRSETSQEDDWLFVVATDASGKAMEYHRGWVRVGDHYILSNGLPMEHGIQINVYNDEHESNLYQRVTYREKLCTNQHAFLGLLGGSQIIKFKDRYNNAVTPFRSSSYQAFIDIKILRQDKMAESIRLESLNVLTSFEDILELSDELKGAVLEQGTSYQVRVPLSLNLLEKQDHSLLVQVTGKAGECVGASFHRIMDARTVSS